MNFIRYNKHTGEITSMGYMDESHIIAELSEGLPILAVSDEINPMTHSVNLETLEIQEASPLSIETPPFVLPEGITPVDPSTLPSNEKPPY